TLLDHRDWRVRAALADGITASATSPAANGAVIDALVRDRDYKVRAAAAEAVANLRFTARDRSCRQLALDDNWHVRERLLRGLITTGQPPDRALASLFSDDPGWQRCPSHIRSLVQRLLLLTGMATDENDVDAPALLGILREFGTGSLTPPDELRNRVIRIANTSRHPLVAEEAARLSKHENARDDVRSKEAFRRLRDHRAVQVALDVRDLAHAVLVARAAADAGAQFIEVGDPLIKSVGVAAIEHVKEAVPGTTVVAEMMSADWGRDQVVLAAEAGADVVLLIGPASTASVAAAVDASRRLGLPLVLDVPTGRLEPTWVQAMERTGIDGFAITTNIDLGVAGPRPLDHARALRSWTKLPIAVSGGFGAADDDVVADPNWDIIVIGRSITDAVDPPTAARQLINQITRRPTRA
ncbi:MAG: hypothetical protein QOH97_5522, partial [Actinoplanes sp.]|nr:hypothetical protein [Actinoplanes sp.]